MIQELEQQKMESIRAIADANMKVSEAKNLLFKLQEDETEYLVLREKKAMDRIQKVVDESQEILKQADQNHGQIKELLIGASQLVQDLLKFQQGLQGLFTEFDERNVEWEQKIGKQQDDLAEIQKQQSIQKVQIENDNKSLEKGRLKLSQDQKKLDSDRGTVERAIKRLKENRI